MRASGVEEAPGKAHLATMFIQTEVTPNPDVLKFLPGREVSPQAVRDYRTVDEAAGGAGSPLAEALFELEGVEAVFLGADYVSVTRKSQGPDWSAIKAPVLSTMMDHFVSGRPTLRGDAVEEDTARDSEIVTEIKGLLDSRIRPAVAQDGGDILFDSFDEATGVLSLRMRGACAGCPSSSATLKAGVEQMMRHYIPEVTSVEQTI